MPVPHALVCNRVFGRGVKCTKGRAYQAVMRSIVLYGREILSVRVADEWILEVFDIVSICHILLVKRRNCVRMAELRRRLFSIPEHTSLA